MSVTGFVSHGILKNRTLATSESLRYRLSEVIRLYSDVVDHGVVYAGNFVHDVVQRGLSRGEPRLGYEGDCILAGAVMMLGDVA